jgi:hypothetical protein
MEPVLVRFLNHFEERNLGAYKLLLRKRWTSSGRITAFPFMKTSERTTIKGERRSGKSFEKVDAHLSPLTKGVAELVTALALAKEESKAA